MKTSPKSTSELKSRSEQLDTDNRPRINLARRQKNRALNTESLLALLEKNAPEFFALAQKVGTWVWISFPDRQPQEVTKKLSEFGFHWNRMRQAWQHPCSPVPERLERPDPRTKYGSVPAAAGKLEPVSCA